jgi:hypothetical protein
MLCFPEQTIANSIPIGLAGQYTSTVALRLVGLFSLLGSFTCTLGSISCVGST